jgi:hypothetical protein
MSWRFTDTGTVFVSAAEPAYFWTGTAQTNFSQYILKKEIKISVRP